MDTSKYLALLNSRALFFSRCDLLGDPFEGSIPRPNSAYWTRLKENRQNPEFSFFVGLTDEQIDGMAASMSRFRRELRTETYISCWHENEQESAAMWSLYSKSDESICVVTTFTKLAEALPAACHVGAVRYLNFDLQSVDEENVLNPIMTKRASFAHEREIRAVMWTQATNFKGSDLEVQSGGVAVPIDLGSLITHIFVNPLAPDWYRSLIGDVTRHYGLSIDVHRSRLSEEPVF